MKDTKGRRYRPRGSGTDELVKVQTWASESERDRWDEFARRYGLSRSAFIVKMVQAGCDQLEEWEAQVPGVAREVIRTN